MHPLQCGGSQESCHSDHSVLEHQTTPPAIWHMLQIFSSLFIALRNQGDLAYFLNMYLPAQVCSKCGMEVPSSNFYACANSVTGLQSWCKDCVKIRDAGRRP